MKDHEFVSVRCRAKFNEQEFVQVAKLGKSGLGQGNPNAYSKIP